MELKTNCNLCGRGALQMFNTLECIGPKTCRNFSQKLLDEYLDPKPVLKGVQESKLDRAVDSLVKALNLKPTTSYRFQIGDMVEIDAPHYSNCHGKTAVVKSQFTVNGRNAYNVQVQVYLIFLDLWESELKRINPAPVPNSTAHVGVTPTPTPTPTFKFAIGDRVKVNKPSHSNHGEIGTVKHQPTTINPYYVVEHDGGVDYFWQETSLVKFPAIPVPASTSKVQFKVGDQVEIHSPGSILHGKRGVIDSPGTSGSGWYVKGLPGGGPSPWYFPESSLILIP